MSTDVIGVRVPKALKEKLRIEAEKLGVSLSDYVLSLLDLDSPAKTDEIINVVDGKIDVVQDQIAGMEEYFEFAFKKLLFVTYQTEIRLRTFMRTMPDVDETVAGSTENLSEKIDDMLRRFRE